MGAKAATSPSHEGVEGTDVGAIWTWTDGRVILFLCLLSREKHTMLVFPFFKKTPSWCPSPVSRPFLPSQSLLPHLVAYLVGMATQKDPWSKHCAVSAGTGS